MQRALCSYFITLKGPADVLARADQRLIDECIVPDYLFRDHDGEENGEYRYAVAEGSMEQWFDVDDVFLDLSAHFPDLRITVAENCEEIYVPGRIFICKNGQKEVENYTHQIAADEILDAKTLDYCIQYLSMYNMEYAAKIIECLRENPPRIK